MMSSPDLSILQNDLAMDLGLFLKFIFINSRFEHDLHIFFFLISS
jgi:hypothetical protein